MPPLHIPILESLLIRRFLGWKWTPRWVLGIFSKGPPLEAQAVFRIHNINKNKLEHKINNNKGEGFIKMIFPTFKLGVVPPPSYFPYSGSQFQSAHRSFASQASGTQASGSLASGSLASGTSSMVLLPYFPILHKERAYGGMWPHPWYCPGRRSRTAP